jgi:hypothetical protein
MAAAEAPRPLPDTHADPRRAAARDRVRARLAEADRYWTDERLDAAYADHDQKIEEARSTLAA